MTQIGIYRGRVEVRYNYGRFGWTRNSGKTWHGGIDVVGLDDDTILMPYYTATDGTQHAIRGTVTRARIVTDRSNKTWEWGQYVCIKLDANQTPDAVNYIYLAHCATLLVKAGQRVVSGQQLAIMGNTGNAAGGYKHCHLEVRATATGTGLDPTAYAGCANAVGVYGSAETPAPKLQIITIGPVSQGDADAILAVCQARGLTDPDKKLYTSKWA